MKIQLTVDVEVDPKDWELNYGVLLADVRRDVITYLEEGLPSAALAFGNGLTITRVAEDPAGLPAINSRVRGLRANGEPAEGKLLRRTPGGTYAIVQVAEAGEPGWEAWVLQGTVEAA